MTLTYRQNLRAQQMPRLRNYHRDPSVPESIAGWLSLPGSLTRHLKRHFDQFQVQVLSEQWARPLAREASVLSVPRYQLAWIRCVHLIADGQPRVYARTVMPATTIQHLGHHLRRLSTQPLGEFVFCHPRMQRGQFKKFTLKPTQPAYQQAGGAHGGVCHGRGSVFRINGYPLLVSEYFLETMPIIQSRFYSHAT